MVKKSVLLAYSCLRKFTKFIIRFDDDIVEFFFRCILISSRKVLEKVANVSS